MTQPINTPSTIQRLRLLQAKHGKLTSSVNGTTFGPAFGAIRADGQRMSGNYKTLIAMEERGWIVWEAAGVEGNTRHYRAVITPNGLEALGNFK